jgi:hypothetical protein
VNAELLRNAWLELTPSRLLFAPLVLGSIFLVVWYSNDRSTAEVATAARFVYFLLVLAWGTRRAANALADEVAGGTWDAQRMTALGPWAMTWGKFFGGTAFVWYTALISLSVSVAVNPAPLGLVDRLSIAVGPISLGLAAMLASFFVVLLHLRRPRGPARRTSFLAQATGIAVGLLGWNVDTQLMGPLAQTVGLDGILWYGTSYRETTIVLATQIALAFWLGFGVYRAMCAELQKPTLPWGWPLVSAFVIGFLLGFVLPLDPGQPIAFALVPVALAALVLFYGALLGDGKDGIKLRWFLRALATGDVLRASRMFPSWLFSLILAAILIIALAVIVPADRPAILSDIYRQLIGFATFRVDSYLAWASAVILFMLRDVALVLYLNISTRARSPDVAATVLLATSYIVLPLLLGFVAPDWTLAVAVPWPFAAPAITLAGPLATLLPLLFLLARRWRALAPHPV